MPASSSLLAPTRFFRRMLDTSTESSCPRLASTGIFSALLLCGLGSPYLTHAAPLITEIMYDVPGADTGHEWVEVTNSGSEPFDLGAKTVRFFDTNGPHEIHAYANTSEQLAPGSIAILADKPALFLSDHPGWQGALFDSVVSLTGHDTIGIQDAGAVLDSVSYDSTLGANGDGNSLHRSGELLIAAAANPGTLGIPAASVKRSGSNDSSTKGEAVPSTSTVSGAARESANVLAHDTGIGAPATQATTGAAGAALAAAPLGTPAPARGSISSVATSPWFAGFLTLLAFSSVSLIFIRRSPAL